MAKYVQVVAAHCFMAPFHVLMANQDVWFCIMDIHVLNVARNGHTNPLYLSANNQRIISRPPGAPGEFHVA